MGARISAKWPFSSDCWIMSSPICFHIDPSVSWNRMFDVSVIDVMILLPIAICFYYLYAFPVFDVHKWWLVFLLCFRIIASSAIFCMSFHVTPVSFHAQCSSLDIPPRNCALCADVLLGSCICFPLSILRFLGCGCWVVSLVWMLSRIFGYVDRFLALFGVSVICRYLTRRIFSPCWISWMGIGVMFCFVRGFVFCK